MDCGSTNGTLSAGTTPTELVTPKTRLDDLARDHFTGLAGRDHRSVLHHGDARCEHRRQIEVMDHHHDAGAGRGETLDQFEHAQLVTEVETCGRFVEQQQFRLGRIVGGLELQQRASQMNALLLAARKAVVTLCSARCVTSHSAMISDHRGIDRAAGFCGIGSHPHDFGDRERKHHIGMLRQDRPVLREGMRGKGFDGAAFQRDAAVGGAQFARQEPQQRRFAGAVGSDQGDDFAGFDRERDAVEDIAAVDPYHGLGGFDQRAHKVATDRCRSNKARKNGAPIAAVMMPIGTSAGAASTRAAVSAQSSRAPPSSIDAGSSRRWAGPTRSRNRCGTTMPTKPIDARDRHRRAGRRRNDDDREQLQPLHRDAGMEGFGFSEHQQVEPSGDERRRRRDNEQGGSDRGGLQPGRPRHRAQQPERHIAQLPVVGDKYQEPDPGIGERRDRDPAQQKDRDRSPVVVGCEPVERAGCDQRAEKGGNRQNLERHRPDRRRPETCRRSRSLPRRQARHRWRRRPGSDRPAGCGTAPA